LLSQWATLTCVGVNRGIDDGFWRAAGHAKGEEGIGLIPSIGIQKYRIGLNGEIDIWISEVMMIEIGDSQDAVVIVEY
jgi:hypothetical protein